MLKNDNTVFKGHRERMRGKLQRFGTRFFEIYELLEMLLYSAIPRKNTHPLAKLLLEKFSSLDALFSADTDELSKVSGVGRECAEFIAKIGDFINYDEPKGECEAKTHFSNRNDIGEFFYKYFYGKRENETLILLLDSDFTYLNLLKIYSLDLSSGAVLPKAFIDAALKERATVCAIAHNHPYAPPFPTDSDWETDKMLKAAFKEAGLLLFESYVVNDEGYKPFSEALQKVNPKDFREFKNESDELFTSKLLSVVHRSSKKPEDTLLRLQKTFASRGELFEADLSKLKTVTECERTSELIFIIAALASRKRTERFKFEKSHSEEEIKDFLIGFYLNLSVECAVVLPLDSNGRVLALDVLSDGTVNALNIIPRMILEKLAAKNCDSFILAHNHPGGSAHPSCEDIESTENLTSSLKKCGVTLKAHYVVARNECNKI